MDSSSFSLEGYDCIGFDLDCTLAEYNVKELVKLVYNLLVNFLIEKKCYESEFLLKPFEEGEYFLQKGLFLDLGRGNVLKIDEHGDILKATHGTSCLNDEEIRKEYEEISIFKEYIKNPLLVMGYETNFRATLDCFDMACVLLFARIVDHLDSKNNGKSTEYIFWQDILEGLNHLYSRNHFATGESEFFSALKNNPSLYYTKWTPEKLTWLKEIKSKKFVYLLTGSFIDFAELTACTCIGEDWKDYFDVVLCYGKKPLFFCAERPFLYVKNMKETDMVKEEELQVKSVYSQGNWNKLKNLISKQTNTKEPKCLYIGDNLIMDVYSPVHFNCCDSVSISLELNHDYKSSEIWGSFFEENHSKRTSYWNHIIKKYATICVSSLEVFVNRPLNFQYCCLRNGQTNELNKENGYYIE